MNPKLWTLRCEPWTVTPELWPLNCVLKQEQIKMNCSRVSIEPQKRLILFQSRNKGLRRVEYFSPYLESINNCAVLMLKMSVFCNTWHISSRHLADRMGTPFLQKTLNQVSIVADVKLYLDGIQAFSALIYFLHGKRKMHAYSQITKSSKKVSCALIKDENKFKSPYLSIYLFHCSLHFNFFLLHILNSF